MTHEYVQAADDFTEQANAELDELLDETADAANVLRNFTDGPTLDVDRLALRGTDDELSAWRATRQADAEWRVLIAKWRDHWKQAVDRRTDIPVHVAPKEGACGDLYIWERPEDCDHQTVRLGAIRTKRDGLVKVTTVHVDIVRVSQQPTPARLLGPSAALDLIGPDGIVQPGHPLRVGTNYDGDGYRPNAPTWLKPQLEPPPPSRYVVTMQDIGAMRTRDRELGYYDPETGITIRP